MSLARSSATSRRLLLLLVVFGLFLVFDIALFGWLIFRSLSEREVEKILLETQGNMRMLAEKIAGRAHEQGSDLYTAVATETETLTFIDSLLQEREFVTNVEILDKEGRLVWRLRTAVTEPNPEGDGTELEVAEGRTVLQALDDLGLLVLDDVQMLISSELPELIGIADRVIVIRNGRLAGEIAGQAMTEETIMHLASGVSLRTSNEALNTGRER